MFTNREGLGNRILTKIDHTNDEIIFHCQNGEIYKLYHDQNCCESVEIEDITGDLNDLIGLPIIRATEDTNRHSINDSDDDSYTWTFYNIATAKGHVTIRWYGSSNGYYSESVDFVRVMDFGTKKEYHIHYYEDMDKISDIEIQ